jgi:hypothetical protein
MSTQEIAMITTTGAGRRRTTVLATALGTASAVAALLAGCSHAGGHTAAVTTPSATRTAPVATAPGKAQVAPTGVANVPKDRKNVAMTSCAGDASGWHGRGTAQHSPASAVTYRVTVFYTTRRGTVVGNASTEVTVPAHGRVDWSTSAKIASKDQLRCVLRGVAAV